MQKKSLFHFTLTALFTAVLLVMDFTPLGYITTGAFSITLMTVPVAIGAICLGPLSGAILGGVFGLTSFLQCFGIGFLIDPSGALMLDASPLATVLVCFVPRIVTGFLCGLIFSGLSRSQKCSFLSYPLACAAVPVLNTFLFISGYVLLFRNTLLAKTAVKTVFLSVLSLNFLIEFSVTFIVGTAVSRILMKYLNKFFIS